MYIPGLQVDVELQEILTHASQETDYYRAFVSAQKVQSTVTKLSDFPLQTRQTVQREQGRFLGEQYQRYPDIDHLLIRRSLGLSGVPLEIYWDSRDNVRSQACLWTLRKERFGVTLDDKCCVFRTAEYAGNKILDYMPQRLSWDEKTLSFLMTVLTTEQLQAYVDAVYEFAPVWMCLPPSAALLLAETVTRSRKSPPSALRYIELCGEMSDADTENIIRNVFQVQTANVYAMQSAGPVAASCTHGHLHIFSENVVIEIIKEDKSVVGQEGEIYITSLHNTAMPLIRLKTGDRGVLQDIPCACGQSAPVLKLTQARNCDFIIAPSGRKISAFVLRSLVEFTHEEVSRCLAYIRFRQTSYEGIDVILRVKPAFSGWEEEVSRIFLEQIRDRELKKMRWNFIFLNPHDSDKSEEYPFFEIREGLEQ